MHCHDMVFRADIWRIHNVMAADLPAFRPIKGACYSVGLHPWFVDKKRLQADLKQITRWAEEKQVVAIGEAGLDRALRQALGPIPEESMQMQAFEAQIKISEATEKPMIIHCVRMASEIIAIRRRLKAKMPWIYHGFAGKPALMEQLLNEGILPSFGVAVLKSQPHMLQSIKQAPADAFFLESDERPEQLAALYDAVAGIRNIAPEALKTQLKQNFCKTFRYDERD